MKRLEEFTSEELLNLKDEEINDLIDLECAYAGVRLLPPCPTAINISQIEPDTTVYETGYFTIGNKEDADKLLELLKTIDLVELIYDSQAGYDKKYIKKRNADNIRMENKKVFSVERFNLLKDELIKAAQDKAQYDKEKSLYNEILKERQDVSSLVYDTLNKIQQDEFKKQRIISQYNRYLTLSNGDTEVAKKFLSDVLHITPEEVKELKLD